MAKWKCEICGNEFDNFHAQGFDNRIYCPLCYFKKENQKLKKQYCERTDCSGRIGNSKKVEELQQENKQLKELIDTILNWNIFKNECPMNFGYDEETNEDKAQDVFYKDDDYCENNCNDDYTKCWLKYFKELQGIDSDE